MPFVVKDGNGDLKYFAGSGAGTANDPYLPEHSGGGGSGGDASAANQVTGNTALTAIQNKVATEAKQDNANTILTAIQGLLNGTLTVSGNFYQATQPVSGNVGISNFPTSFNIGNFPATQPVSIAGSIPVTGSFYQATQPVSGAFWQATQPVSIASSVAITASSLPLATGAATSANQTSELTKLDSIIAAVTGATPAGSNTIGNVGLAASELHLGEVGGRSVELTGTIIRPADTNIYTSGDQWADSTTSPTAFLISGCSRINNGSGQITQAVLMLGNNPVSTKLDMDILVFSSSITPNNDNAPWAPSIADMRKCRGIIPFRGINAYLGNPASGTSGSLIYPSILPGPIGFQCKNTGTNQTALWFAAIVRNNYTPGSNEELQLCIKITQD